MPLGSILYSFDMSFIFALGMFNASFEVAWGAWPPSTSGEGGEGSCLYTGSVRCLGGYIMDPFGTLDTEVRINVGINGLLFFFKSANQTINLL